MSKASGRPACGASTAGGGTGGWATRAMFLWSDAKLPGTLPPFTARSWNSAAASARLAAVVRAFPAIFLADPLPRSRCPLPFAACDPDGPRVVFSHCSGAVSASFGSPTAFCALAIASSFGTAAGAFTGLAVACTAGFACRSTGCSGFSSGLPFVPPDVAAVCGRGPKFANQTKTPPVTSSNSTTARAEAQYHQAGTLSFLRDAVLGGRTKVSDGGRERVSWPTVLGGRTLARGDRHPRLGFRAEGVTRRRRRAECLRPPARGPFPIVPSRRRHWLPPAPAGGTGRAPRGTGGLSRGGRLWRAVRNAAPLARDARGQLGEIGAERRPPAELHRQQGHGFDKQGEHVGAGREDEHGRARGLPAKVSASTPPQPASPASRCQAWHGRGGDRRGEGAARPATCKAHPPIGCAFRPRRPAARRAPPREPPPHRAPRDGQICWSAACSRARHRKPGTTRGSVAPSPSAQGASTPPDSAGPAGPAADRRGGNR